MGSSLLIPADRIDRLLSVMMHTLWTAGQRSVLIRRIEAIGHDSLLTRTGLNAYHPNSPPFLLRVSAPLDPLQT